MRYLILIILGLIFFSFASCKKKIIYTKENLTFSADTIIIDTIFTTIGSTTKRLKFYNANNLALKVDEIELIGGESSPFNINIDGEAGSLKNPIEMSANDSLFIFIEVTLSVNNSNLPLIVEDSIRFRANGVDQYVNLVVWGQDAYFHANSIVSDNEPWLNDKPHVIYGIAGVGFPKTDSNLTLTIPAGTEIYCHKDSYLYVYKSSLFVQGALGNEVKFKHDRLESFYDDNAGQWGGLWLSQAKYCEINYATIENASIGLRVDTTNAPTTLKLTNSIIQNSQFYNLFLVSGAAAEVENSVFGDAGLISAYLFAGGVAQFKHCNFVNYWQGSRGGPALAIKNWYEFENTLIVRPVFSTVFENCIMYGNAANEYVTDSLDFSPAPFDVIFKNCLMKREEVYAYANFMDVIWNQSPLFTSPSMQDYHFEAGSPLDNAGSSTAGTLSDIEGNSRNVTTPDIGAYEFN